MTPRLSRLGNGFTIASLAMPGVETAALSLGVDAGSRHEAADANGLAHLFEHMVFKGTMSRSARAIAEEIEDVGGTLNAWTSRDATMFHARVLAGDLPLALDLIADLVTSARFDPSDLELERQVVRSEIGEAADTPDDAVFDHLQEAAFPGQPLGRPILGSEESLGQLDRDMLAGWRQCYYAPGNLVLAAAGRVDHAALVALAGERFGERPAAGAPRPASARWVGGIRSDQRSVEQVHIALGHEAPSTLAPDHFAAQLFVTALGGGMSSRLFQELREDRGLAYSVSASHGSFDDTGMMSIYLAARPADAAAALDLARTVAAATASGLEPAELERARAQLKAGLLIGLEGCAAQADWLARSWISHGRLLPPDEVVALIEAVDLDAARAAGRRILSSPEALAVVGPRAARIAAT